MFQAIENADLAWKCMDGIEIPYVKQFEDIDFSQHISLLETCHVFTHAHDLENRLAKLEDYDYFHVGETSFGTGLNVLAIWQLWQCIRPKNHSRLHVTTVEKFPLTKSDLIRALNVWPELKPLADQLIHQYPLPIAGCHRLSFPDDRFSIDLWLGDAHDIFPIIPKTCAVDAWFLDSFTPVCNPDIWQEQVLKPIVYLSKLGTTLTSLNVSDVLKQGLQEQGIHISSPPDFLHNRSILKGSLETKNTEKHPNLADTPSSHAQPKHQLRHIAIIGAGIAGLSCAHAFAQRGHQVTVFDQSAPLAGASGNPLALLNPKLCPIEQSAEHLMTLAWQHALNHYSKFRAYRPIAVHQLALKNATDLLALAEQYPKALLHAQTSDGLDIETTFASLVLNQAGSIYPHQLKDQILEHPLIRFKHAHVGRIEQIQQGETDSLKLIDDQQKVLGEFDHVVVCCAKASQTFFADFPVLKPIRGQVSWVNNQTAPLDVKHAYSYGGYCMQLNPQELILGASFYPNRDDDAVLLEDHQHNLALIASVFPSYAKTLPEIDQWQGRASVRAQSLDYFPLLGKMRDDEEIYTFSGLGSKGFLFAPLCSEILAAEVLAEACPVPMTLKQKLNPKRFQKKVKTKRPYFKATSQPIS